MQFISDVPKYVAIECREKNFYSSSTTAPGMATGIERLNAFYGIPMLPLAFSKKVVALRYPILGHAISFQMSPKNEAIECRAKNFYYSSTTAPGMATGLESLKILAITAVVWKNYASSHKLFLPSINY